MSDEQPIIERRIGGFQRHGERIVSGLILTGIAAICGLIFSMNDSMQQVLTKLEYFEQRVTAVEADLSRYQTKEAAAAAWAAQDLRDQMTHARINQVENRVDLIKPRQETPE